MSQDEIEQLRPELQRKIWAEGYLYILDYGDGETFKIGITKGDPEKRMNQITEGAKQLLPNPLGTKLVVSLYMTTNPYYLEQLLHMQHADKHAGGEWFSFAFPTLCDVVACIKPFGILDYHEGWYDLVPDDFLLYVVNDVIPHHLRYADGAFQWIDSFTVFPSSTKQVNGVETVKKIAKATKMAAEKHNQMDKLQSIKFDAEEPTL